MMARTLHETVPSRLLARIPDQFCPVCGRASQNRHGLCGTCVRGIGYRRNPIVSWLIPLVVAMFTLTSLALLYSPAQWVDVSAAAAGIAGPAESPADDGPLRAMASTP